MPRRPPPSPLLLHTGPTPPRSQPKHFLPVLPPPTFYPTKMAPVPTHPSTHPRAPAIAIAMPTMVSNGRPVPPCPEERTRSLLRGPWDHSRSLSESTIDVDSLVRLPKPAAVTVGPLLSVW